MNNLDSIKEMLISSDIDSRYLGISILRNDTSNVFDKEECQKLIKSVNVKERIKNFGDICNELNITEESCLLFKEPKTKEERCFNALNKIFKIVEYYNRDKPIKGFPDFTSSQQHKYFPYYQKSSDGSWLAGSGAWSSDSHLPALVYFNNEENCIDAMNKFIDIFSDYLI